MTPIRRMSQIYFILLITIAFSALFNISVIPYLQRCNPLIKQQQAVLQKRLLAINNDSFGQTILVEKEPHLHRTYLTSRTRCTQNLFLVIVVLTSPANFDRRKIIRRTWASDPSIKPRWKTMFLLGESTGDSTQQKHLEAESLMYSDFIRGSQREHYHNLTLKTEMGLEWAAKYCDFHFLVKADDDVFVNPYRLMDHLRNPDTPRTDLYMGRVVYNGVAHRGHGKYGVSWEEYNKIRYPDFCSGPCYVLSSDLVDKLVEMFDVKKPLKLEDVYIGTLVAKLGVKAVRHWGFHSLQKDGSCNHYSGTVVYHRTSIQCMEELYNVTMKERVEQEQRKLTSVKTGEEMHHPGHNDTKNTLNV